MSSGTTAVEPLLVDVDDQESSRAQTSIAQTGQLVDIDDEKLSKEYSVTVTSPDIDIDAPHAPYRPPEPVIEPPEHHPPGYVPGVISGHPFIDDDVSSPILSPDHKDSPPQSNIAAWHTGLGDFQSMDLDQMDSLDSMGRGVPERPVIGMGVLPTRWLQVVHEHDLIQPIIEKVPLMKAASHGGGEPSAVTPLSPTISPSVSPQNPLIPLSPTKPANTPPTFQPTEQPHPPATITDIWTACPGGQSDHQSWYFCPVCWGWMHITHGQGTPPSLRTMAEWEMHMQGEGQIVTEHMRSARLKEMSRYNDLPASRLLASTNIHHLHEFNNLIEPDPSTRLDRIQVDDVMNAFPHRTPGLESEDAWTAIPQKRTPPKLYASSDSDLWIIADGIVPGQIPPGLVRAFTDEKICNPSPGKRGVHTVTEAWELLST